MAFPDFSEFSFGYALVRQIEEALGGQTVVPSFPTQPQEANKGYDVDFLSHGVPLFIQMKRSEVIWRKSCRECKDPSVTLSFPFFRMHLHRSNSFRQHFLMQDLEERGNIAIYCTSSIASKEQLDQHYFRGRTFDAAEIFRPLEIILPSLDEAHHVSFNARAMQAFVCSEVARPFIRSVAGFDDLLSRLRAHIDRPVEEKLAQLERLAGDFSQLGPEQMAARQRSRFVFPARERPTTELEVVGREYMDREYMETFDQPELIEMRRLRHSRIQEIESVVVRVALEAFFEADAMLVSVSREALSR